MGVEYAFPEHFDFIFIWRIRLFRVRFRWDVRSLQDLRYIFKIGMMHDIAERVKSDLAETDILVAVFAGAGGILAVVDMEDGDLVLPDDPVKLFHDVVEMMDDVIAAVAGVAGVEADAQFITAAHSVIDAGKLLECAADLRSLSRHRLKRDETVCVSGEDFVEPFDDLGRAGVCPRAYM